MKKILLMAVAAMMAISASAQETIKKVRVYEGSTIVYEQDYSSVDSVVFFDYITPVDPEPEQPETPANPNFHAKAFTVNAQGKQVYFSQGNLQYQASTNTWRFAENQYDMIGDDNQYISSTYEGWIDLFGWGTSGYDNTANDPFAVNYQPWAKSTNQLSQTVTIKGTKIESINCEMQQITGKCDTTWSDGGTYKSDDSNSHGYGPSTFMTDKNLTGTSVNYDWGVYNAITNGGGQAGLWRTLTREEWNYIFNTRPLAQYLRSQATVCGVHGYVLLPDEFTLPEGLSWSFQTNNWDTNTYGSQAWCTMETSGAVFLPAAGIRYDTSVFGVGSEADYWSASYSDQDGTRLVYFTSSGAYSDNYNYRHGGRAVRLVKDIE